MNATEKRSSSRREEAYHQLKQAIIDQSIAPGDMVNERRLAQALGISRTPVREALQMLETERWVTVLPWRGVVVRPVTPEEVDEVFQLRLVLEPMVVEMLAGRISRSDLYSLDELLRRQGKIASPDQGGQFIAIDQEFHLYLAEKTGNAHLLAFMTQLRDIHLRLGVETVCDHHRFEATLREHRAVVDGLKEGNAMAAKQAMLYHIVHTHEAISNRVRNARQNQGDAL
ncbi:MAG: GntR family transcriptional regulator [Deltaproteobacteria bacterium]|nr:GntR family transcriptional regulator [Deltaproteobacteria bacterium]